MRCACLLTFCLLVLTGGLFAADPAVDPVPADLAAKVNALVTQLDVPDPVKRLAAAQELRRLPGEGLELMETALKRDNLSPQVRLSLRNAATAVRLRIEREKRLAPEVQFQRRALIEAYEKIGAKDPGWDADARQFLTILARWRGPAQLRAGGEPTMLSELAAKLRKSGCNDPLVAYFVDQYLENDPDGEQSLRIYRDAMKLAGSGYSPVLRCAAYAEAANWRERSREFGADTADAQIKQAMESALALLPEAMKEAQVPRSQIMALADALASANAESPEQAKNSYESSAAAAKHSPDKSLLHSLKARVLLMEATLAAANGYEAAANKHNVAAMEQLAQAMSAAPDNGPAATLLLQGAMAADRPREELDKLFEQAMKADPDNQRACQLKLQYIFRHGGADQMLAFGRQCAEEGNYAAEIPNILISAHEIIASSREADNPLDYYKDPEVWREVSTVYEGILEQFPSSVGRRSQYVVLACQTEHWDAAHKQFQILGERWEPSAFGSKEVRDQLKRQAARNARR